MESQSMNVREKLQHVQGNLKAPKGQKNTFGNYNYRNCEDILEAVKPLLAEVRAVIVVGDELQQVGDRYYIKATAKFLDCDGEAYISNTAYAREEESKKGMDASQITGSTSSYARKYALNGLLAIDDTKDSDATNQHGKDDIQKPLEQKQPPIRTAVSETAEHNRLLGIFHQEIRRTGKSLKFFLTEAKVNDANLFPSDLLTAFIDRLKQYPTKE